MQEGELKRSLNIPNALSLVRIGIMPVFLWFVYAERYGLALAMFAISAVTDGLDGYIARSRNQETRLGKIMDPVADKLILMSSYLMFGWTGLVPVWLVALLVGRDIIVIQGVGTLYAVARHFWVDPIGLGKAAIAAQFVLLCYVLARETFGFAPGLSMPLYIITAALSAVSGVVYIWGAINIARKEKRRS